MAMLRVTLAFVFCIISSAESPLPEVVLFRGPQLINLWESAPAESYLQGHSTHFSQFLVPGSPWVHPGGEVVFQVELDMELQQPIVNHIRTNWLDYSLCVDGGLGPTCSKFSSFGLPLHNLVVRSPDETGGVSRVSVWLQFGEPATIVVGNVTVFLWGDDAQAEVELGRLLASCDEEACSYVVNAHLRIARARLLKFLEARMEPLKTERMKRGIVIISTIFNSERKDRALQPEEGTWIKPLMDGLLDQNIRVHVKSATILKTSSYEDTLSTSIGECSNVDIEPFANPKLAKECPGFLSFIIEHYNSLPDLMILLHGYPFDHNALILEHLRELFEANREFGLPELSYVHLNPNIYTRCYHNNATTALSRALGLDDELLRDWPAPGPGMPTSYPCYHGKFSNAQFIVSRAAVHRRPLSFYRLALKLSVDQEDCIQLEWLWHAIFRGEKSFTGLHLAEFLQLYWSSLAENSAFTEL